MVAILQYNGDRIFYTRDGTRYLEPNLVNKFGSEISISSMVQEGYYSTEYFLLEDNGDIEFIFRDNSVIND